MRKGAACDLPRDVYCACRLGCCGMAGSISRIATSTFPSISLQRLALTSAHSSCACSPQQRIAGHIRPEWPLISRPSIRFTDSLLVYPSPAPRMPITCHYPAVLSQAHKTGIPVPTIFIGSATFAENSPLSQATRNLQQNTFEAEVHVLPETNHSEFSDSSWWMPAGLLRFVNLARSEHPTQTCVTLLTLTAKFLELQMP